jgi:hypothetical protein
MLKQHQTRDLLTYARILKIGKLALNITCSSLTLHHMEFSHRWIISSGSFHLVVGALNKYYIQ